MGFRNLQEKLEKSVSIQTFFCANFLSYRISHFSGHKNIATDGEKKICLWPISNNQNDTSCGKTFTKMDSLKRHIAENHKGVRPFACSLCDKTYGRRDYLQRHLKSHNANYAVNLQSASNISASQVVQKVQVHQPHHSINHHSPSKNTIILQQGQGGTLQVVSSNSAANSSATQSGSGGSRYVPIQDINYKYYYFFQLQDDFSTNFSTELDL